MRSTSGGSSLPPRALTSTTPALLTLFSGLNLGPGTYFLTLTSPVSGISVGGRWEVDFPPLITTDSSVNNGNDHDAAVVADYAPASMFSALDTSRLGSLEFTVTLKFVIR